MSMKYYIRTTHNGSDILLSPVIRNGTHQRSPVNNSYRFTVESILYRNEGHPHWIKKNEVLDYEFEKLQEFDSEEEAVGYATLEEL